ncbi:MAG: folate-binding protein [Rubrivivax sp.]|nr:folate-binding protein [Rubrivivax sp.]
MDASAAASSLPQGTVALDDWGVIRASGEDARRFLHGQLTQDIEHLEASRARLAGYCSAKGRLLATFVAWRTMPDEVWLACSADVLPAALKRLSMYVLRAKCKLSDAGSGLQLRGLAGEAAMRFLGDAAPVDPWAKAEIGGATVVRLPDGRVDGVAVARWLWAAPLEVAPPALPALDTGAWRWLEVTSGVARVVAATAEQFVPQMVNLELVGGVNFQKGCYPGQEVVARSQYRGTLKRRAFVVESDRPLAPGQEVFHVADPDQPAGMVVLAADWSGRHAALVELKLAAADGAGLAAGALDGPSLVLSDLPYTIPAEAA